MDCGCQIDGMTYELTMCSLHAAAEQMRDALAEARLWLDDSNGNDDLTTAIKKVDAALSAAKGEIDAKAKLRSA